MKVSHEAEVEEEGFAAIVTRVRDVLRRRWKMLALVAVAVFALGVALILMMAPKYTSVTHVRIDPSRSPTAGQQSPSDALTPEAIETEVTLIRSDETARAVVRKLNLTSDPEFTQDLKEPSGAPMSPADKESAIAFKVLDKLDVGRDKLSYILTIAYTSRDRLKSAEIANAFAQAYIAQKVGATVDTASQKSRFLDRQLAALGDDIHRSEAELANYRAAAGLVGASTPGGTQPVTIVDQQIAPLSATLATARSDAAAAQASLAAAQSQAAGGNADNVAEVLASPVIGQLRAQRATALQNMGEVLARYGDKHPETIKVRNQLNDIDSQIKAETNRIMASLRARADAAQARVGALQQEMDGLAARQATNARNAVAATALEAEIATKRQQYDKLSQAALESTQAANNQIASAQITDVAKPPLRPTSPNKPLLLALALIVALSAGVATITVQELMAAGLRTIDDVEEILGVPMLAAIPMQKGNHPADVLLSKPTSLFAESLRIARASILGVRAAKPPQVIAITSALPGEGKTTTALAFARTLAMNGQRTLLIDCDVRRASMRELVSNPADAPGIVEVLYDNVPADQAIRPGDTDNLDQMLVRAPHFSSGNLFGDGKMERVIASLRGRYELIVLDLPPLVGLADGRFLAAMADTVAMVLRWNQTPAQAASVALQSLRADDAHVAGVIFSMVDNGAEVAGGLYYSKKYAGYYQQA